MKQYDLELTSTGMGWGRTFTNTLRYTADDILSDGEPYGPVEVTYEPRSGHAITLEGTLSSIDESDLFLDDGNTTHSISIDAIRKFRA